MMAIFPIPTGSETDRYETDHVSIFSGMLKVLFHCLVLNAHFYCIRELMVFNM